MKKGITKIVLLDDIDKTQDFQSYYCANIKEKTFNCNQKLTYKKGGGFGLNYRYCSNCYELWNELDKEKQINKYYNNLKVIGESVDFLD
jgi:hypothetical protein